MAEKDFFGEDKNIEYKREIPGRHEKFLKDIIAFSNCTGGTVVLGVEDGTHVVCGIGERNPFRISDDVSNMISDACTPQIIPDITIQTLEGKTVLVIYVPPGRFRPYYLKSSGKETSSYVRINGTSRPADSRMLKELELEGQHIYYDSMQEIGMEYEEEKALQLCAQMKRIAMKTCRTEDEKAEIRDMTVSKLEDMGILCAVGQGYAPTHAFNLLTDNTMKHAKIQCALFKGTQRDVFIDRKEFKGPIYSQIEDAYQFVLKHINLAAQIEGIVRRDVYELPIGAVREAIANAVVHRSYLDDSCIQISMYDDRIEILSPGMLYGGLDLGSAKTGKSKCRNSAVADAFYYMRIIEAWGTGIPRIIQSCREYGLKEPLFEELGDSFRVTIYRKGQNAESIDRNVTDSLILDGSIDQDMADDVILDGRTDQNMVNDVILDGSIDQNADNGFSEYRRMLEKAGISRIFIFNIEIVFCHAGKKVFRQSDVMEILHCSKTKAANVIRTMRQADIVRKATGQGPGRYQFI